MVSLVFLQQRNNLAEKPFCSRETFLEQSKNLAESSHTFGERSRTLVHSKHVKPRWRAKVRGAEAEGRGMIFIMVNE